MILDVPVGAAHLTRGREYRVRRAAPGAADTVAVTFLRYRRVDGVEWLVVRMSHNTHPVHRGEDWFRLTTLLDHRYEFREVIE